jgi:hypothetical protein
MNVDEMEMLDIDIAIATRVMGLVVVPDPVSERGVSVGEAGPNGADLKKYSIEIAAAWEIVEKVKATSSRGYVLDFLRGEWTVGNRACGDAGEPELYGFHAGRAETAPLAICRAALRSTL